jgi:RNA polymerase-interacting CarD/CdnL/TRCF family regulator
MASSRLLRRIERARAVRDGLRSAQLHEAAQVVDELIRSARASATLNERLARELKDARDGKPT